MVDNFHDINKFDFVQYKAEKSIHVGVGVGVYILTHGDVQPTLIAHILRPRGYSHSLSLSNEVSIVFNFDSWVCMKLFFMA